MKALLLIPLLLLCACRAEDSAGLDNQTVCTTDGKAYFIQPHVGDTSFTRRTESADDLCKALRSKREGRIVR